IVVKAQRGVAAIEARGVARDAAVGDVQLPGGRVDGRGLEPVAQLDVGGVAQRRARRQKVAGGHVDRRSATVAPTVRVARAVKAVGAGAIRGRALQVAVAVLGRGAGGEREGERERKRNDGGPHQRALTASNTTPVTASAPPTPRKAYSSARSRV